MRTWSRCWFKSYSEKHRSWVQSKLEAKGEGAGKVGILSPDLRFAFFFSFLQLFFPGAPMKFLTRAVKR
jgi:hypothetical protein